MDHVTYTATGSISSNKEKINLSIAIPNPPLPAEYKLKYYNLSRKSNVTGDIINTILCEFTFKDDDGSLLSTPTSDTYDVTLYFADIQKAPTLSGVEDFDFSTSSECLFLFFHSTDADNYDEESFFDVLEELYDDATKGPYTLYPAPLMKTAPTPTGKPRVLGGSPPMK